MFVASTLTNLDAGVDLAGMFAGSLSGNEDLPATIKQVSINDTHYFYATGHFSTP